MPFWKLALFPSRSPAIMIPLIFHIAKVVPPEPRMGDKQINYLINKQLYKYIKRGRLVERGGTKDEDCSILD
jgi:hypothetical protein